MPIKNFNIQPTTLVGRSVPQYIPGPKGPTDPNKYTNPTHSSSQPDTGIAKRFFTPIPP